MTKTTMALGLFTLCSMACIQQPEPRSKKAAPAPAAAAPALAAAAPAGDAPAAAAAPANVLGDAAKGEVTFKQLCVTCHGDAGKGDGPVAAALNPKPADFTDAKRAALSTDQQIFNVVKEGGAANGKSPLMAAWKGTLDDEKIRDVVAYVRHFSKPAAQ